MKTNIKIWHVEILDATRIPPHLPPRTYELKKLTTPLPEFNRFLYLAVGAPWNWYMRLEWTYQQWQAFLNRPGVETWVAYQNGTPIGYFELEKQNQGSVEIAYFGLIGEFIGQGFGRALLEDAIAAAWQLGGRRVWLHTCSLDHPSALGNYLSRGFVVFKEEQIVDNLPDSHIEPWSNAGKYTASPETSKAS
jgi:GNAT superfamily N-acetyltransferase